MLTNLDGHCLELVQLKYNVEPAEMKWNKIKEKETKKRRNYLFFNLLAVKIKRLNPSFNALDLNAYKQNPSFVQTHIAHIKNEFIYSFMVHCGFYLPSTADVLFINTYFFLPIFFYSCLFVCCMSACGFHLVCFIDFEHIGHTHYSRC